MATDTTNTATRPTYRAHMTPTKLAELKKGPKANIMIGPDGDRFIGLEGASVHLLAHFSPYAQKKLIDERGSVLYIPNGSKNVIVWIYKYMQAGEADPERLETFANLTFDRLVLLYQHCAFLDYDSLMTRTIGRLKGKFYGSLPSVDEIKLFASSVPPLYAFSIDLLTREMTNPWTCNYRPYLELADSDQTFGKDLDQGVQDILASRIKRGEEYYQQTTNRQVLWSKGYLDKRLSLAETRTTSTTKKTVKQDKMKKKGKMAKPVHLKTDADAVVHKGQDAGDLPATSSPVAQERKAKSKKPFNCFNCGGEGHIARNCDKVANTKPIATDESTEVKGTEQPSTRAPAAQTSTRSSIQKPFKCYHCGEIGHMARDCTADVPAAEAITSADTTSDRRHVRDTTGRNKYFRRAQRDRQVYRPIAVVGNGEGLRTCDREVKKGEMTRAGLIV